MTVTHSKALTTWRKRQKRKKEQERVAKAAKKAARAGTAEPAGAAPRKTQPLKQNG